MEWSYPRHEKRKKHPSLPIKEKNIQTKLKRKLAILVE